MTMANCTTCRHNDKKKRYCSLKRVHTDLGYVLNCVAWEATDELKIRGLRAENAKLRELCASLFRLANNECLSDTRHCDDCPMSRSESPCNLSLDFIAMRRLGIDVTPWEVERVEVDG